MNKKVALSLLSATVFASMTASAFAAPNPGVYMGGDVDKYYALTDLFKLNDAGFAKFQSDLAQTKFENLIFVDHDGKGATLKEILSSTKDFEETKRDLKQSDFEGEYAKANLDGTNGPSYDPRKDITPEPTGELKVESVSAVNAKELVVEFNQAVKEDSIIAQTSTGSEVAGTLVDGVVKVDSASADSLKASLSKDGKKLTIVAAANWEGAHSIEFVAGKVQTADGKAYLDAFVDAFNYTDDVRASISGVDFESKFVYTVNFSEPVQSVGTVSAKLADGTAVTLDTGATGYGLATDGKSFKVFFANTTPVNQEISVSFPALTDYANNVSIPLTAKITIDGTDNVKPVVTSATAVSQTKVQVKFSEPITVVDPTKVKFNGNALSAATVEVNAKDKTVLDITVPTTTTSGALLIEAGAVEDLSGNANNAYSQAINFAFDKEAPVVSSTEVFKDSGLNKLRVTFSEDVTKVGTTGFTLKYTDEYGVTKTVTVPDGKIAVDTTKKNIVVVDLHDGTNAVKENVTYTVDIPKGYFQDTFGNDSELKTVTFVNSATAATTKLALIAANPIVAADTIGSGATRLTDGAFVDVQFADAVDVTTATNASNYTVEGAEVAKAELVYNDPTTATANGAKAVVRVYIKDDTVEESGNYNVTVKGVKGYYGNVTEIKSTTKNVQIAENVRPTVISASFKAFDDVTPSTTVTLTFSESIASDAVADGDFELYVDGKKVSTATVTNGPLGTSVDFTIDVDLSAEVAAGKVVKLVATSDFDLADDSDNKANVKEVTVK
ncbi:hypothetical protein AAFJ72_19665 [Brevibacillus gelatini]|uniref:hypothetical protein n=1 Tax=Brevibacillus gelatini TaxID=1655277 RepID=UPI003D819218